MRVKDKTRGLYARENLIELQQRIEFGESFAPAGVFSANAIDGLLKERLGESHVRHLPPQQTRTPIDDDCVHRHPPGLIPISRISPLGRPRPRFRFHQFSPRCVGHGILP